MNTKFIATVLLVLVALLSVSMVSAIDENTTNDSMQLGSSLTDKTFTQLQKDIDNTEEGGVLELSHNYSFIGAKDKQLTNGIKINKNIIINGNGYTINSNNMAKTFYIQPNVNLVLNNVCLTNSLGVIYGDHVSNNDITINNCHIKTSYAINMELKACYEDLNLNIGDNNIFNAKESMFLIRFLNQHDINVNLNIGDNNTFISNAEIFYIHNEINCPNRRGVNLNIGNGNNFISLKKMFDIADGVCGDPMLNMNLVLNIGDKNKFNTRNDNYHDSSLKSNYINFTMGDYNQWDNTNIILQSCGDIIFEIGDNNKFIKSRIRIDSRDKTPVDAYFFIGIGKNNVFKDNMDYDIYAKYYYDHHGNIIVSTSSKPIKIITNGVIEYTADSIETPKNNAVGSALKLASKVNTGLKKVSAKVAQNVNTVNNNIVPDTKLLPVVTPVTKVIDSPIAKTVNNNIKTFASSLTIKKPTVQGVKIGWGISDILKSNH